MNFFGYVCLLENYFGYVWVLKNYFGYVVMVLCIFFQVWMYEYFRVGPEIREEVTGIFPRFLRWLAKHRLSTPSRRSLEI